MIANDRAARRKGVAVNNGRLKAQSPYGLAITDVVALSLKDGAAPMRCYVGSVEHLGADGIRITTIDWLVGAFTGYDIFVPWASVESALIATKGHDLRHFFDEAAAWQRRMCRLDSNTDGSAGQRGLVVDQIAERSCPLFICEQCGDRIRDAAWAFVLWIERSDAKGPRSGPPVFVHKQCSHAYELARTATYFLSDELSVWLRQLVGNCGLTVASP